MELTEFFSLRRQMYIGTVAKLCAYYPLPDTVHKGLAVCFVMSINKSIALYHEARAMDSDSAKFLITIKAVRARSVP